MARGVSHLFTGIFLMFAALSSGHAAVSFVWPQDLQEFETEPCSTAPCNATVVVRVSYSSGFPVRRVDLFAQREGGGEFTQTLCLPPDPIEPGPQNPCPSTPGSITKNSLFRAGTWTLTPTIVKSNNQSETGASIRIIVREEPIDIGTIEPHGFSPRVLVGNPIEPDCRSNGSTIGCNDDRGMTLTVPGGLLRIQGDNLDELASYRVADNRRALEVFLAPIPFQEPVFLPGSGIQATNWCRTEALEFVDSEFADDEIAVRLPQNMPIRWSSECGVSPPPPSLAYGLRWRVVLRDRLINDGHPRVNEWWGIPSPRQGSPAQNHPALQIQGPDFPEIFGYDFPNVADSGNYKEFTSVYGDNAYFCIGGFGICATRVPDPIYHTLGFGLYKLAVNLSDGSCVGMASSSQLVFDNKMSLDDYDLGTSGLFPIQVQDPDGSEQAPSVNNNYTGRFNKRRSCSPVCGGYVPDNLWSRIRQLHGRQFSREYLTELLRSIGSNILNSGDLGSIRGAPQRTLNRIANDPSQFVVCTMKFGGGHCVTPYEVVGNRIRVYDNNDPGNSALFIQVNGDTYEFNRIQEDGYEIETGTALYAFPVDTLDDAVRLYGLSDLLDLDGEAIDFLMAIVAGGASMSIENANGGRWGPQDNGEFADSYRGAIALPAAGGLSVAEGTGPLLLPIDNLGPNFEISSDGAAGIVHLAHGGKLFQVRVGQSEPGKLSEIQVGYDAIGRMDTVSLRPDARLTNWTPRIGMVTGELESVVAAWEGVNPRSGSEVAFSANAERRSVTLHNRAGTDTPHMLVIDHASGLDETFGRTLFGPLVTPAGAVQTAVLTDWPDVGSALLETDLDGDGVADHSRVINGVTTQTPTADDRVMDLSVALNAETLVGQQEARYRYGIDVFNQGPSPSTNVLVAISGEHLRGSGGLETTEGVCDRDDGLIHCTLSELNSGRSARIEFELIAPSTVPQLTTAIVFGDGEDADDSNNQASLEAVAVVDEIFATGFE